MSVGFGRSRPRTLRVGCVDRETHNSLVCVVSINSATLTPTAHGTSLVSVRGTGYTLELVVTTVVSTPYTNTVRFRTLSPALRQRGFALSFRGSFVRYVLHCNNYTTARYTSPYAIPRIRIRPTVVSTDIGSISQSVHGSSRTPIRLWTVWRIHSAALSVMDCSRPGVDLPGVLGCGVWT